MNVQDALTLLGLSDKESAVYIALLQLGKTSSYAVSVKSGLKKPTTYVILDELIKKGLVKKVPRLKKQHYVAESPEQAFALAEEKIALAKQKLPELLALTKGTLTKVNTIYFEGIEGVKQLMEYGMKDMRDKEYVGFFALAQNAPKELQEYFPLWNEKMKRLGATMRVIVPDHPSLDSFRATDTLYGRVAKVVPLSRYSSDIAIDVSDTTVRIHDYKNLQGIAIENADVAKTMREIFEMCWKQVEVK